MYLDVIIPSMSSFIRTVGGLFQGSVPEFWGIFLLATASKMNSLSRITLTLTEALVVPLDDHVEYKIDNTPEIKDKGEVKWIPNPESHGEFTQPSLCLLSHVFTVRPSCTAYRRSFQWDQSCGHHLHAGRGINFRAWVGFAKLLAVPLSGRYSARADKNQAVLA